MVHAAVIPSLLIAVLTALQMVTQKHVAQKLSHHTVFVISAIGYFILSLFYMGYHRDLIQKDIRKMIVPVGLVLLVSIVFSFLANMVYFSAIRHHDISLVSALTSVTPIFVAGIAVLVLKEALSVRQIVGIAGVVGGTMLIAGS
jgi:hypothetical protein